MCLRFDERSHSSEL
ncbi:Protein CBG27045 [Caenorhabditis briggsae]|uniref:Protein CBG27045 n=1 Tax=Caenorhabditis briggsae TaxID=6238 RepID=B6IMA9_CAEBR|nr:Protein CBG27045 [Caenorhabditis briggsae]CAS01039.1 Protein CBG27045 [Caenorhabditis briggsae]